MNLSFPNVPNITPTISVTSQDAFNLLLISIAMEKISLSHVINAEAEKIQYALGTLPGLTQKASLSDLLHVNKDVRATIGDVILKDLLLTRKLDTILQNFIPPHPPVTPPCPPGTASEAFPPYR
jgi:hypothetical protein